MLSDPIADFCTRIRNAYLVKKTELSMPYSKIKEGIAKILVKENYLESYKVEKKKNLLVELKYDQQGEPAIKKIERVSKPGLRIYRKASRLPRVLSGLGLAVVSTPKGLMTNKEAKKKNLGGEVVCQVW